MEEINKEEVNRYLNEKMVEKYGFAREFYIENNPWAWFGKIWNWAKGEDWWDDFVYKHTDNFVSSEIKIILINHEVFPIEVYNYLRGREK